MKNDGQDAQPQAGVSAAETVAALLGFNGATFDRLRSGADNGDAVAVSALGILQSLSQSMVFNGTSWDRVRGVATGTVLASAVRAATNQSADQTNYSSHGLIVVLNITAVPGVDTITPTVQGKDPVSGSYYTLLAGAAQVATGTIILRVNPSMIAVANTVAADMIPRTWRVSMAHSAASNFTYSVGAIYIP